jgi:hypothetical protein
LKQTLFQWDLLIDDFPSDLRSIWTTYWLLSFLLSIIYIITSDVTVYRNESILTRKYVLIVFIRHGRTAVASKCIVTRHRSNFFPTITHVYSNISCRSLSPISCVSCHVKHAHPTINHERHEFQWNNSYYRQLMIYL